MTSRERVLTAMDGGTPDRVPCALGFYHVAVEKLVDVARYPDYPVDVYFVEMPVPGEQQALADRVQAFPYDTRLGSPAQEGTEAARVGSGSQVGTYERWGYRPESPEHRNPLADARTLDDLRAFPFPEGVGAKDVGALRAEVARWHARGLAVGGNPPRLGGELFESAWRLRGLEAFLLDLVERPAWADYLLDRLMTLGCQNAETLASAGVDVLALDDDVGMPGTMYISPELWRRFFRPRLAAIIGAARAVNPDVRVLYHSEGSIEPIVGDLMEMGVNALNPLQPEHMDAGRIRATFGSKLALWGTVGRQTTFSFDRPQQIQREVRERIETLGRAGLILCPAYDIDEPDIPGENVAAFLDAARRYG
ncbi:MAG TPA: uroporphyrinogen decarboxylase family protein [Phycisphaerae bacterium]|nr:uroporphyrinogen decarboxylase family protein [Phycisphaerae bacterium]